MWGYVMFCIVFWILKCLPDSYDGRKWLAKVQVNNSSQVISQDFLVRLDSAELTWLGSGLKTFVTCLWLDFICFMTWHEFKYPVDLKQRNKSSSVIVTICNVWHHGPESSYSILHKFFFDWVITDWMMIWTGPQSFLWLFISDLF